MIIDLDFRAAWRSLARSPGYVTAVILSLTLGIGAGAAAFGVIDAVRLRGLPFPHADRLVLLSESTTGPDARCPGGCDVSYETFANVLRPNVPKSLDALAGYTSGGKAFSTGGEPLLMSGGVVSPNLFELLDVRPALGRTFSAEDDRLGGTPVVVLSHDLWATHLGSDPDILGKVVKLSDTQYTVIGVMPAGFNHEVRSQFWLAVVPTLDPSTRPSIRSLTVIGRLAPGRTLAQLNAELATIDPKLLAKAGGQTPAEMRIEAAPLRDRYAGSTQSHDLIFAAIVGCVLLIACANIANLALVRALSQQREFAVRSALGARSARLMRGLMAQNVILIVPAAVLGLLFASWFLGVLQSLAVLQSLRPSGMEYRLDARVMGFATVLALGIGALLSLVSSRAVGRADVQRLLRDGGPSASVGRRGSLAQQVFVVAQVAAAVALLTGAGLLAKTSLRLAQLDLGFEAANVLSGTPSFPHPWRVKEKYLPVTQQILLELGRIPGAQTVALRASVPLGSRGSPGAITLEGQAAPLPRSAAPTATLSVSPGYFGALGIAISRGRDVSDQDLEATPPVAVINEWAAARWWPGQDPIGRIIRIDTAPSLPISLTVVGVVRNNKAAGNNLLLSEEGPEIYRPWLQSPSAFPTFFVRAAGSPTPLLRPIRLTLARLVPDRPLFASAMADNVRDQLGGVRLNAIQILAFALVGLGLALLGIHGVLSYAVRQRTQEIGIRGALGASRGGIERMVLADAARLTGFGVAIGLPVALLASGLIKGMLHGVSPSDPAVYVLVALAVGVVSLLAAYAPARRAARVDPVIALRSG